ncbi:MAG: ParB N-terminal domain-containing protein [Bacteroidales bacterium]|nr:ParB N-terminal domain-containing protein [Bacteroidales bacterium]
MKLQKIKLSEIKPYERNARKNDEAVEYVIKSIKQCEYIAPIILDENNVILAGHTRYKALKKLGYNEAECVIKEGLTEEQKKKYRLLDNKTAEFAEWDFDLLKNELDGLDFEDLDIDWGIDDFTEDFEDENNDSKYTDVINIPQYTPTGEKPDISELIDRSKTNELIQEISKSNIQQDVKNFLIAAAYRHYVFNYSKIAEYYAHADKDVQELMEKSALVIIDLNDAIKNGFTRLKQELAEIEAEDRND